AKFQCLLLTPTITTVVAPPFHPPSPLPQHPRPPFTPQLICSSPLRGMWSRDCCHFVAGQCNITSSFPPQRMLADIGRY
ncbi:hypothetical protein BDZ97DRAFT_1799246, partial [Flammula alnicola]